MARGLNATLHVTVAILLAACAARPKTTNIMDAAVVPDTGVGDMAVDVSVDEGVPTDTGVPDAAPTDASTPFVCDWVPPSIVSVSQLGPVNSDFAETDPFVTADGLTIYFSSTRDGEADVYVATRTTRTGTFGTASRLSWAGSTSAEWHLELSADLRTVYLAANLAGGAGMSDIWVARRATATDAFGAFSGIDAISDIGNEIDPHISADGLSLYYASDNADLDTAAHFQVMIARRETTSVEFQAGSPIAELFDADSHNANATLTADQKVIVYTTTRVVGGGATEANIFYATRASAIVPFGHVMPLPHPINNPTQRNHEPFITADGCQIYFSSTRNAVDDDDLFVAIIAP